MDSEDNDLTLVVAEREFLVNRNAICRNSGYFKAMLEGGFEEGSSNRVELHGIVNADAFAVLLDYILNKKIDFKSQYRVLPAALDTADMLNDDRFSKCVRIELRTNWPLVHSLRCVLEIGERLNVRSEIMLLILQSFKETFVQIGKCVSTAHNNPFQHSVSDLGLQECFWNLEFVVDVFKCSDARAYVFHDFKDIDLFFVKGIIWWVFHHKPSESGLLNIWRNLGLVNIPEICLKDILSKYDESEYKTFLDRELQFCFEDIRNHIQGMVFQGCFGKQTPEEVVYNLNFDTWTWEEVRVNKTSPSMKVTKNELQETFDTAICYSSKPGHDFYFVSKNIESPSLDLLSSLDRGNRVLRPTEYIIDLFYPGFRNNTLQTKEIFCAMQEHLLPFPGTISGDDFCRYRLTMYKLFVNGGQLCYRDLPIIKLKDKALGCQLVSTNGVLHGFVSYVSGINEVGVGHFEMVSEVEIAQMNEVQINPMLVGFRKLLVPVATAVRRTVILVLFLYDFKELWLSEYNLESKDWSSLGFLPSHPVYNYETKDTFSFFYLGC